MNYINVNSIVDIANLYRNEPDDHIINFGCSAGVNAACLAHFIGQERFRNICSRQHFLDLPGAPLSKTQMRHILLGLLDVQVEDVAHLEPAEYYPFHTLDELESLMLNLGISIDEQLAVDRAQSSGKGLTGLAERVYILARHHLKLQNHPQDAVKLSLADAEMLSSRLADREMQANSIIHLSDGYFKVDRVFIGWGAYVSALRSLEDPSKIKLVCRGTAMRSNATEGRHTALSDLLIEIGSGGVKDIWPQLAQYLQESQIATVDIFGKSLGGAQAQSLAVLVEGLAHKKVTALTTYCSLGVSPGVHALFNQLRAQSNYSIPITVIRNGGSCEKEIDHVPCVGGAHLGLDTSNVEVKVYYLQPEGQPTGAIHTRTLSFMSTCVSFLRSFKVSHLSQMTLKDFRFTLVEGAAVRGQLLMGTYLEKIRLALAYFLHVVTFGKLNGESFRDFYAARAARA